MLPKRFFAGFRYAYTGFVTAVRQERNLRFHLCTAFYVYLFSLFYEFGKLQYALITILVCGVLALEMVNSSIERTVDHPAPERYMTAGLVKDMAAGAVLVFSIGAAVCGGLLFWDVRVFHRIWTFFSGHLWMLAALVLSFVPAYLFVFYKEKN